MTACPSDAGEACLPDAGERAAQPAVVVASATGPSGRAAATVVERLHRGLAGRPAAAVLWFAAHGHDPAGLAPVLSTGFPDAAVAGCSQAADGVTAVALPRDVVVRCTAMLAEPDASLAGLAPATPLRDLDPARHVLLALVAAPEASGTADDVCDRLAAAAPLLDVVGCRTDGWVAVGDRVARRGGVVLLLATAGPFAVVTTSAFAPSGRRVVVTRTDPAGRVVRELDHLPAVEAYADAVGIETDAVDATVFGRHPLAVVVDGVPFVRTPDGLAADGALTFPAALRTGVEVEVVDAVDLVGTTTAALRDAADAVGEPCGAVLFDDVRRHDRAASDGAGAGYAAALAGLPAAVHVGAGQLRLAPVDTCLVGVVLGRPVPGPAGAGPV